MTSDESKAAWSAICKDIDLDDADGILERIKAMRPPISLSDKIAIAERDGPDCDGTFEGFMWSERKMTVLLWIIVHSSSVEEILAESESLFSIMAEYDCLSILDEIGSAEVTRAAALFIEGLAEHYRSVEDEFNDGPEDEADDEKK
ncbi:MAG: hypothetical protein WC483_01180 [Candidatus Paceibacterota bacterium]